MMFKKMVVIAVWLLVGMYAVTGNASGTHDGEHKSAASGHHGNDASPHGAKKTAHDDDHEHEQSLVGRPAPAAEATKVIEVTTLDTMRYEFSTNPDIEGGDVVRFVITNKGKIPHEFSIGDAEEQDAHREMMRKMPNMVHEDGNTITIKPGETRELTWKFSAGGEVVFACNIPGHFEAGMFEKATVGAEHVDSH